MHLPELYTIKRMRKQARISQTELSKQAGVSQSMIARIESGKVDPSYSNAIKIFTALKKLSEGKILCAKDIMSRRVVFVNADESVKKAAYLMKKRNVSQLPVLQSGAIMGSITEKDIVERVSEGVKIKDLTTTPVKDVMNESFPLIDSRSSMEIVSFLLEYNPAVLVSEKGKIIGIVTKADTLKLIKE